MSKFVLFSVLIVLMSMYPQINSFGIVRVNIQKDPVIVNAISNVISTKIQSLSSILSSILALKSSYKTVNINSSYGGTSSGTSSGSTSGSTSGSSIVYNTIPLYKKTINVNYGVAPVGNTIEESSNDAQTTSSSSVGAVGQTIFTAAKVIGGVPAAAASESVSTSSASASGSASVALPKSVGYIKTYG